MKLYRIIPIIAGIIIIIFRTKFSRRIILYQNEMWGFNFSEKTIVDLYELPPGALDQNSDEQWIRTNNARDPETDQSSWMFPGRQIGIDAGLCKVTSYPTTNWGTKRYMNMGLLVSEQEVAVG